MVKEEFESIKKRFINGDEALEKGDFSAAYCLYVLDNNYDGLFTLANILMQKGEEEKANKVLDKGYKIRGIKEKLKNSVEPV